MLSSDLFMLSFTPIMFFSNNTYDNINLLESPPQAPPPPFPQNFNTVPVDYSHDQNNNNLMKFRIGEASGESSNSGMQDYTQAAAGVGYYGAPPPSSSFDKLSFSDVMHFSDFGPKLALNNTNCATNNEEEGEDELEDHSGGMMDPVLFLKFPVLNDKSLVENHNLMPAGAPEDQGVSDHSHNNNNRLLHHHQHQQGLFLEEEEEMEKNNSNPTSTVQENNNNTSNTNNNGKSKRKRPRTIKTSEEVESQRMTHIAVERNRRKQMNEHLRVLRSLMPGSYVQRVRS